jgi:restriction endonuclease S subunit
MSSALSNASVALMKREKVSLVAATGLFFEHLKKTSPDITLEKSLISYKGGTWGDESVEGIGFPILRSSNMRGKRVDVSDAAWCNVPEEQAKSFILESGDILVTKSSGSIDLVGKAALFNDPNNGNTYLFSNFTMRLRPDRKKVTPEYLAWFLRSPQAFSWRFEKQQTTVGLRNLQSKEYLSQVIPIPDLDVQQQVVDYLNALENGNSSLDDFELPSTLTEQRRIVAHIESLAARVNEAQRLREEADEELNTLLISMAHRSDSRKEKLLAEGWVEVRLSDVIQQVKDRIRVEPNTQYPNLGIYSFARGLFHKQPIDGNLTSAKELYRVHKGQFVYSRLFAFEGACGYIPDEYDGCYVSGEYPTFDCDPEKVKPEFLYAYFKSLGTWKEISAGSKGLGDRRQRVQPEKFLEHKMLLPPLKWQNKIVAVMHKLEQLHGLQSQTENELNALLPSILDQAFKGRL